MWCSVVIYNSGSYCTSSIYSVKWKAIMHMKNSYKVLSKKKNVTISYIKDTYARIQYDDNDYIDQFVFEVSNWTQINKIIRRLTMEYSHYDNVTERVNKLFADVHKKYHYIMVYADSTDWYTKDQIEYMLNDPTSKGNVTTILVADWILRLWFIYTGLDKKYTSFEYWLDNYNCEEVDGLYTFSKKFA